MVRVRVQNEHPSGVYIWLSAVRARILILLGTNINTQFAIYSESYEITEIATDLASFRSKTLRP